MSDYEDYINTFAQRLGNRKQDPSEDWQDIVYALMNQSNRYHMDDGQDSRSFHKEMLDPMIQAMGAQRAGQLDQAGLERMKKIQQDPTYFDDGRSDMDSQLYGMLKKR